MAVNGVAMNTEQQVKNEQAKVESKAGQRQTTTASQTVCGCSEMETKSHSSTAVSTLTQEVESLKVVVDLRNAEISQLKQSNAEVQQQASC